MMGVILYIILAIGLGWLFRNAAGDGLIDGAKPPWTVRVRLVLLFSLPALCIGILCCLTFFFPRLNGWSLAISEWGFRHSGVIGAAVSLLVLLIDGLILAVFAAGAYLLRKARLWILAAIFLALAGVYLSLMWVLLTW